MNRTMIGISIKRISVLHLCHVLKPFVNPPLVFRLICLLIKIVFAAILSGLVVMRNVLEKKGKNVLGYTAFCIDLFQQISVYI